MKIVKLKLSSSRKQVVDNRVENTIRGRNKDDVFTIKDLTENIIRINMK
jgi:hypothetical protein